MFITLCAFVYDFAKLSKYSIEVGKKAEYPLVHIKSLTNWLNIMKIAYNFRTGCSRRLANFGTWCFTQRVWQSGELLSFKVINVIAIESNYRPRVGRLVSSSFHSLLPVSPSNSTTTIEKQ